MNTQRIFAAAASFGLLMPMALLQQTRAQQNDAALIAKAKGIHDRVIKLDTHNDIDVSNFTPSAIHCCPKHV
jgi:membrane dipeptidase